MREYKYEDWEKSPRGGADMNKGRLHYTLSLVVVLSFLLILGLSGCSTLTSGEKDFSGPTRGFGESSPDTFPLYAGQNTDVGEVKVWNDGEKVYVKYQLSEEALAEGWRIYETHLAVGTTLEDIPRNKPGNPQVGHFPLGDKSLGGVAEAGPYYISLEELGVDCGENIIIAAHAVVKKSVAEKGETAWGGTEDFPGKNWATYFTYTVACEEEEQEPTQGCSHGYWKNVEQHSWPGEYNTDDELSKYFGDSAPDLTLMAALKYSGPDWPSKLAREAVAALLNAESEMNYALSVDDVKNRVSNAFLSGDELLIKALHTQLEKYNAHSGLDGEENCPL